MKFLNLEILSNLNPLKEFDQTLPVCINGEEQWQSYDREDFDIEIFEGWYTDKTNRDADGRYLRLG